MSGEMAESSLPKGSGNAAGECRKSTADLQKAGSDAANGSVVAELCALGTGGMATLDGEMFAMMTGQFHMSVDVDDWHWCGCEQQEGKFLEFNFTVDVPAGYKISSDNTMPVRISLGANDSFILISSKVSSTTRVVRRTYM